MKFRNQYEKIPSEQFATAPGNPIRQDYIADEEGNPVPSGTTNVYAEIQSHRASVELSTLLQRYVAGDETALNKIEGIYADVTDVPSSLQELHERVRQAEDYFRDLPEGLRKLFNNSPIEYVMSVGSTEFLNKILEYNKSLAKSSPADPDLTDPDPGSGSDNN